jgi:hypothetical protein
VKDVIIRARFPEERYSPNKGTMLELTAFGSGSNLRVALRNCRFPSAMYRCKLTPFIKR